MHQQWGHLNVLLQASAALLPVKEFVVLAVWKAKKLPNLICLWEAVIIFLPPFGFYPLSSISFYWLNKRDYSEADSW